MRNPWDFGTHLAMAEAFEKLDVIGMAIWTLDQIRQVEVANPKVNRPLARLFEKVGNFTAAAALWEMVRKADPSDLEAQHKFKDLAASATIAKGRYEDAVQGMAPTPMMGADAAGEEGEAVEKTPLSESPTEGKQPGKATGPREEKVPRDVAALQAKIQTNPTNANAYLHLAAVYRRADQVDMARKVLQGGLTATGNQFDIAVELVDLDIEPFRRDLSIVEDKLSKEPADQELQTIRARLAKEVAARELDLFRQKSERFPTDTAHRFEMGVRLLRCGQVDEAIRELQTVRNDPRHQGKALVYLGYCFQTRKNWKLAQRNFEEALGHLSAAEEKLRKEILYQLAKGYAETGDLTRAVDMACELANLDFSYKDIGKLLDDWTNKMQRA
jgi:tetratricopeptide (TPR) repeat protein